MAVEAGRGGAAIHPHPPPHPPDRCFPLVKEGDTEGHLIPRYAPVLLAFLWLGLLIPVSLRRERLAAQGHKALAAAQSDDALSHALTTPAARPSAAAGGASSAHC